jgi:hypothetical protein
MKLGEIFEMVFARKCSWRISLLRIVPLKEKAKIHHVCLLVKVDQKEQTKAFSLCKCWIAS